MRNTKVKELMTPRPAIVDPSATLYEAAEIMKNINCGILPVGTEDKVEGMITDRDIVIRAISDGKNPLMEKVRAYMTKNVFGCNEDDFLEDAAEKMHNNNVSRLIVRDHDGNMTGILSFGSILRRTADVHEIVNVVKHAVHKAVA